MTLCCKVGKAIDQYDLKHDVVGGDIDEYLLARWKGHSGYTETGLRPLERWFNQKILKKVYNNHGLDTIETRIESDYEVLTGDNEVEKDELLNELSSEGIDGEAILDHFISFSTLGRHFNNCLDEHKEKKEPDKNSDWEQNKIEYMQNSMKESTNEVFRSLDSKGRIKGAANAEVKVPVILTCPHCSNEVRFNRALKRGYVCEDHMDEEDAKPDKMLEQTTDEDEADTTRTDGEGLPEDIGTKPETTT